MVAVVRSRTYLWLALALVALMLAGFARTYYLRALSGLPPLTLLLHLHGIVFTAWMALFVCQAWLISARDYRTHMRLGQIGMAVAALVVIIGVATAVMSAAGDRTRAMGMTSVQFVLFPLSAIVAFGVLVACAYVWRRDPGVHRRLMVLAMVAVLGPAVARVLLLVGQSPRFLLAQTAVAAFFVAWCLIADWRRHRIVHPIYAVGGALLVLSWPFRAWFARTPAWEAVGGWLAKL